jgi:hypothetical protein
MNFSVAGSRLNWIISEMRKKVFANNCKANAIKKKCREIDCKYWRKSQIIKQIENVLCFPSIVSSIDTSQENDGPLVVTFIKSMSNEIDGLQKA